MNDIDLFEHTLSDFDDVDDDMFDDLADLEHISNSFDDMEE